MQQLLWLETLLKLLPGLLLATAPLTTLRLLGLPRPETGFWPRLLGALLIGLAAATFIEGTSRGHGLGMAGVVVINLCSAAMLGSLLALDKGPVSTRGRIIVWGVMAILIVISIVEIAHI